MAGYSLGDERVPAAIWAHLQRDGDGCWLWSGSLNHAGYGRRKVRYGGETRTWRVHRLTYTALVGEIAAGMTLDHLCRVRHCCNPAHLEPVTQRVNSLRGETVNAVNGRKTRCPKDHPYSPENTYVSPKGRRTCRTCRREKQEEWRQNNMDRWRATQQRSRRKRRAAA